MTTGPDPLVDTALSVLSDEGALKSLADDFTSRTADALVRKLAAWSWNRAKRLWSAAEQRVRESGRIPKYPRVEALLEITRYGASEERPQLRDAFENLAARAMTDDEWDHDYEEYAHKLSRLRPKDITLLDTINSRMKTKSNLAEGTGFAPEIPRVSEVAEGLGMSNLELMGIIDRLEITGLVQVIHENLQYARGPGVWFDPESGGLEVSRYSVAPTVLGLELLQHVSSIN